MTDEIRSLLVEADSYISHMRHRGSWPGDDFDVDRLIGRLRDATLLRRQGLSEVRERLSADAIAELIALDATMKARVALLLAYYLDSDDPAVAEAFVHTWPAREDTAADAEG